MSESTRKHPAAAWPPGVFLQEEIAARGWTAQDLAGRARLPVEALQLMLDGLAPVTARSAARIGRALGTGPEVWLNLQAGWEAWRDLRSRRERPDTGGDDGIKRLWYWRYDHFVCQVCGQSIATVRTRTDDLAARGHFERLDACDGCRYPM